MNVSIHFSTTDLRLLVGNPGRASFQIDGFFSARLPEGVMINGIITAPEPLAEFLGACNQQWGPFKHDATVIIENNTIRTRSINLPALRSAQLAPLVRSELAPLMEEGQDDIVDYATMGSDPQTGAIRALGVVAGRVQLENYARVVRAAGFNLKRVDIGTNTLTKLPQILPVLQGGIRLLGIIDGSNLVLVYYQQGVYLLAKRYRLLAPEATDERRTEIQGHLSAMVQFQKSQNRDLETDALYLTGIPPERVQLFNTGADYLGIPATPLEMPATISLRSQAGFNGAHFDLAAYLYNIGALLRK
ncbi:MAG: hypothetical protein LBP28_09005 [Coriobacteriales bacterium]|jgi:hypothetical protein|nr:hypothetical protein [Coriobacteriales bacterium]